MRHGACCCLRDGAERGFGPEARMAALGRKNLVAWLFGFGILGLLLVLLAIAGRLRILLFLFAFTVFVLLAKGFFYGFGYSFENPGQVKNAGILIGASFVAFLGAWPGGNVNRRRGLKR